MCSAEAHRLRCDSGTILGREVVPEVCSTSAMSSGSAMPPRAAAVPRASVGHERKAAGTGVRARHQFDDPHAQPLRDLDGRTAAATRDDQRLGLQVAQVELELLGAVGRIERRARDAAGAGHEAGRHLGAVVEHDRDPVVAPDAEGVEPGQRGVDQRHAGPRSRALARPGADSAGASASAESNNDFRLLGMRTSSRPEMRPAVCIPEPPRRGQ